MIGGFCNNDMRIMILMCALVLSGCGDYRFPLGGLPTPHNYINHVPPGPKAFRYGWAGGCRSAASSQVSIFYGDIGNVGPFKDYEFAKDSPDYEIGWQIAFWYCVRMAERADGLSKARYEGLI